MRGRLATENLDLVILKIWVYSDWTHLLKVKQSLFLEHIFNTHKWTLVRLSVLSWGNIYNFHYIHYKYFPEELTRGT